MFIIALSPQLETTFHGDETLLASTVAALSAWLGWVLPFLLAEWWLERGGAAKRRRPRQAA